MERRICAYRHPGVLVPELLRSLRDSYDSLLDVGCGPGVLGYDLFSTFVARFYTLDIYPPPAPPPHSEFTLADARQALTLYGPKSMDAVICCEMIEHLSKEDGVAVFDALEGVARRVILFTTPNGFTEQDPDQHPQEPWARNPYQRHLCGYTPEEFEARGYTVILNSGSSPPEAEGSQIIAYRRL